MNDDALNRLREALSLMATNPAAAADLLEGMAAKLMQHARSLRALAARGQNPLSSPGGMGDRCRIQVIGPGGEIKQEGGTEGQS